MTTDGITFFPCNAHFLHSRHVLTMSVQASKTLVGKPADLNMFCMVVNGQCHQRRCSFRISRCTTAPSGDLKARKLVVKLNRVQSFVVAEPEAASLVVTRGALDVDEDDVLSPKVLAEFSC